MALDVRLLGSPFCSGPGLDGPAVSLHPVSTDFHLSVRSQVKGSKETRAEAITPLFEAGRRALPTRELMPIVDDSIDDVKFPSGRHVSSTRASTP